MLNVEYVQLQLLSNQKLCEMVIVAKHQFGTTQSIIRRTLELRAIVPNSLALNS